MRLRPEHRLADVGPRVTTDGPSHDLTADPNFEGKSTHGFSRTCTSAQFCNELLSELRGRHLGATGVRSVGLRVRDVLGTRSPSKILKAVVSGVTVQVPRVVTFRALANERLKHENVHKRLSATTESYGQVSARHACRVQVCPYSINTGMFPLQDPANQRLIDVESATNSALGKTFFTQAEHALDKLCGVPSRATLRCTTLNSTARGHAVVIGDLLPFRHARFITRMDGGCHYPAP